MKFLYSLYGTIVKIHDVIFFVKLQTSYNIQLPYFTCGYVVFMIVFRMHRGNA